ncbi:MAG: hypothetical protein A2Y07_06290 [Planctomycetes bacterium GWF2_50_10]|nr:MAG: hypothetical protein A2Y07_06290 [Planctomycetes bacterium GWF2_50_10]
MTTGLTTQQDRTRQNGQTPFGILAVAAHELKAPLSAVQVYLELMKTRAAGDDIAAYDHILGRSLIRLETMRQLILDIIELARIEAGRRPDFKRVDVAMLAAKVISDFGDIARADDIHIELKTSGHAYINASIPEIEIILNNLVSNAIKYNKSSGKVTVSVRTMNGSVIIEVTDTGIGIAAEDMDQIFTEFSRIKNDKTVAIEGTGLGLAIVRKITQVYNGSITVRSEPGNGSTFTVVLCC